MIKLKTLITESGLYDKVIKSIISLVKQKSHFDIVDNGDDYIEFSTRENGNVGDETTGAEDVNTAVKLQKLIKQKFGVTSEIEEVDEWVHLNVTFPKEKKIQFVIKKHSEPDWTDRKGTGFGKGHTTETVVDAVSKWTDIPKSKVKQIVKKLTATKVNQRDYTGEFVTTTLPSKSMGYYWTLIKYEI